MKISYNWLQHYHDLDLPADKVAEMLTGCGLEVESQEPFQSVKGGLKGVVIGEVLTCQKHPNSDHLSLTTVSVGGTEPLHIVCGASNVAKGQKVVVATIGSTLYFNDKELTLQRTKIRGEVSEGMICAEDELGLGNSHAGIMVLPDDACVGQKASDYFGIEEDLVFTIGLTPNRVDAASHVGVARDLVAVANNFGKEDMTGALQYKVSMPDVAGFAVDHDKRHIDVVIEAPEACLRYSALTVSGISVGESPEWLKNRLLSVGLRPINNIVDITNYILMEVGQPLHAFDCDKIAGQKVIVKKYPEGTRFVTLDNIERKLSANDLMISNTVEPMCLAGVFGGIESGVTSQTTSIFLESACFDPRHIRKSSRFHGLQTDASFRFERGTSVDITMYALQRAALLIKEIAGGEISSEIVDVYPSPVKAAEVELTFKNLDRLIGKSLNREVVKNILADLGIGITGTATSGEGLMLSIPAYKVDVTREADVIEEILRIYGYNNIAIPVEMNASLTNTVKPDPEKIQNMVSDYLVANGFNEIMSNSLTRSLYYTDNPDYPLSQSVKMLNPISRDLDVMRQTLLYGVLEAISFNQNRKSSDLKLFEFGRVYSTGVFPEEPLNGYHEEKHLAMVLTGLDHPENWRSFKKEVDLFDLKGLIEGVFLKIGLKTGVFGIESYRSNLMGEGLRYIFKGKPVLTVGPVVSRVLKTFDIKQSVFYAEMNWDAIFLLVNDKGVRYQGIPKFPEVRRDLALVVDSSVTFSQLEQAAHQAERKLLKSVGLFDVYEGEKIPSGKKSYALSLILQDADKTLTDKEIDKVMEKILKCFISNFNAQLR